jgi:hypothetical protein
MKLSDYILQPREVRIAHIDLSTPCDPQGSRAGKNKQAILDFLGIEDDLNSWAAARVNRCHLCTCDSTKGWCANPLHYYIGTAAENTADQLTANPYCTNPFVPGLGSFINESGEVEVMKCEEARARGLKGAAAGRVTVFDSELGRCVSLPAEEAKSRGLKSPNAGQTKEGVKGASVVYDPLLGRCVRLPIDEAQARGLSSPNAGRTFEKLVCPHCGTEAAPGVFGRYHGSNCVERVGSDRWLSAQEKAAGVTLTAEERAFVTAWA